MGWLRDFCLRLVSPHPDRVPGAATRLLRGDSGGLHLHPGDLAWGRIVRVTAFKRDLGRWDLSCLAIEDDQGLEWEVHEEQPGFHPMLGCIEDRLGPFPDGWRERVLKPAFATNWTVLHERRAATITAAGI